MRMVLLRHDLPDGSSHFDWMIESSSSGRGLLCFRVQVRIDQRHATRFEAERIGEHRREFLTYEGPVSGNRGSVVRIASGNVSELIERDRAIEVRGNLGAISGTWRGEQSPLNHASWCFTRLETPDTR